MTGKDAAEILKTFRITGDKHHEALDVAIKALKQEPCDDAISREDALMCLTGEIKETDTIETIIARFVRRIRNLPLVNPQPKTGHWIKYSIPRCGEQHYQCTSCKYYINLGQWGELYTKEFKYCPNCGAKMVEPQERSGKE